jgi:hypothetical protein
MTVSQVHPVLEPPVVVHSHLVGAASARFVDVLGGADFGDIVDEWGAQSFPASDPPSNW